MAQCIPWKEKVARSITTAVILFCTIQQAWPQTMPSPQASRKISLTCKGLHFPELIEQLASATGLHFIYSPNKIKTNALIYLTVREKPVEEVLSLLGNQLNLVFKKQDRHVVIKAAAVQPSLAATPTALPTQKSVTTVAKVPERVLSLPDSTMLMASARIERPAPSFSNDYFKKHLQDLQVYFDSATLTRLPAQELRKINLKNNHRGLFISAGLVLNDYSFGTELQVGIRSAYAVFNTGLFSSGQSHSRYGVGSSLLLSRNFAVNPVYTFASIRERIGESPWKLSARHHELKIMLQYSVSKSFAFRFGPSFSYLTATYTFEKPKIPFNTVYIGNEAPKNVYEGNEPAIQYGSQESARRDTYITATPPQSYYSARSWMGWEASVSYKLNLFKTQ